MKVVKISELPSEINNESIMKILFDKKDTGDERVIFGFIKIQPGSRIPLKGNGTHDGDEYSIILNGSVLTQSAGIEYRLSSGEAAFIPANEEHWAYNDGAKECEIVWAMIKR